MVPPKIKGNRPSHDEIVENFQINSTKNIQKMFMVHAEHRLANTKLANDPHRLRKINTKLAQEFMKKQIE